MKQIGPTKQRLPETTEPPIIATIVRPVPPQAQLALPSPEVELARLKKRKHDVAMIMATGCGIWTVGMWVGAPYLLLWNPYAYFVLAALGPPALLGILMVALD